MAIKKNIGGDRLGSGAKMQVDLKTYNRSTHDLGYIWRSTMSAGTLVPFIKELALPGDTFDIDLDVDVKTHPTIGPLFGSYKVQLDLFFAPIRLYQSGLHNNALGIGLKMQDIKLPQLRHLNPITEKNLLNLNNEDVEAMANDPSSLLAHLDIIAAQLPNGRSDQSNSRLFCAVPYLAYYDIYKNYYSNKQEEVGMFININTTNTLTGVEFEIDVDKEPLPKWPDQLTGDLNITPPLNLFLEFENAPSESDINEAKIRVQTNTGFQTNIKVTDFFSVNQIIGNVATMALTLVPSFPLKILAWVEAEPTDYTPQIKEFPLENIDEMREKILATNKYGQVIINADEISPYGDNLRRIGQYRYQASQYSQQGLALKTYQSDLFNNWMSSEWIDNSSTGINAITAIDTSDGSFTLDTLNLANKVYDMLNRIAISGGTYDDWLETVYTHEYINRTEVPVYHGGLSRELVFQEVVSVSESEGQPLGTLAGKGILSQKKKGGKSTIKIDEPGYIIGIASLTPRIDYSQGNKWDVNLETMDDLHKPALDEIGFQDLITDQMAWWTTTVLAPGTPPLPRKYFQSAGKQPAWINYMTNVNKVRGNFAKINNEMFMTLNRRYEVEPEEESGGGVIFKIKDLTTYIDPSKFNFIFADTDLTSQNFWVQIAANITARRKMSAKIMPNL